MSEDLDKQGTSESRSGALAAGEETSRPGWFGAVWRGAKRGDARRGVVFGSARLRAGHSGSCGDRVRPGRGARSRVFQLRRGRNRHLPVVHFPGRNHWRHGALLATAFDGMRSRKPAAVALPTDELVGGAGDVPSFAGPESKKRGAGAGRGSSAQPYCSSWQPLSSSGHTWGEQLTAGWRRRSRQRIGMIRTGGWVTCLRTGKKCPRIGTRRR